MSPTELEAVRALRRQGYAVVVFSPAELGEVDPSAVEDLMVERGQLAIEDLGSTSSKSDLERKVITHMVEKLKEAGWLPYFVDYGDGAGEPAWNLEQVLEEVFAVEESKVLFMKGHVTKSVLIVLGNDGYDCIADHSLGGDFEEVMDEVQKYAESLV